MIQEFIKKVGEFHNAFGVKRGNVDVELRYKLFLEEYEEYLEAKNLVEKADAIVNMLYIACGTIDLHEWKDYDKLPYFKFTAKSDLEILKVIKNNVEEYRKEQIQSRFVSMVHCVFDLANYNNIYNILPQLLEEVHLSNLSKLDENGKPIINDGVLDPNKPIGKILKGKNYFEPNLEKILNN